jgi:hypothetical protein
MGGRENTIGRGALSFSSFYYLDTWKLKILADFHVSKEHIIRSFVAFLLGDALLA